MSNYWYMYPHCLGNLAMNAQNQVKTYIWKDNTVKFLVITKGVGF